MKRAYRIFLAVIPLLSCSINGSAQDLTGIWRGYFIGVGGDQYKYEVQIDQSKSNFLNGVTYSYLEKQFYGKATFTGNFSKGSKNALVQEIKTVEVKMAFGSVSCIMKCKLQYVQSGKEEFLEGTFESTHEKDSYGAKKGEDCGSGTVYLRKVKTSDFYVEPSLRAKIEKQNQPGNNMVSNKPVTPPATSKPIAKNNTTTTKKPTGTSRTPVKTIPKEQLVEKPVIEPAEKENETDVAAKPEIKIAEKKEVPTPFDLRTRTNELVQTIIVHTPEVVVRLYDNGEIDDDTISVYLDKRVVLSKKKLTTAPLTVKVKLDDTDPEHELVMVAENMGRIPPNTSLMIVDAGDKRYEVRITSTEQQNAMVRFRYVKPGNPLPLP